ncbi:MAG: LysR family transcriptional regulator [Dongiaceae bacterium]
MKLSDVDLQLLRFFAVVADSHGFSAAEPVLNVNRSTISRRIADLESRLGVVLCSRGRGGFKLTKEGEFVRAAAQELFDAVERCTGKIQQVRRETAGGLHVGMIDGLLDCPSFRLAPAIARFRERHPFVQLHLHVAEPSRLERDLIDGNLDLSIGSFEYRANLSLSCRHLFSIPQYLYCGVDHPFFARTDATISDDEVYDIGFAERGYISVAQAPEKGRFNTLGAAYTDEGIAALILSGKFIGYLNDSFAEPWVKRNLMRPVAVDRFHYNGKISALYAAVGAHQSLVTLFVAALDVQTPIAAK